MDQSRFEGVSRLLGGLGSRRMALSAAALSGLALAGNAAAKDDVDAEGKKRGRRGKKGKQGPQGPQGPAAGASAQVVSETCSFQADDAGDVGTTDGCQAACPNGYVAVGGGYEGPTVGELARVNSSFPIQSGGGLPTGWESQVEYLAIGPAFELVTYVICLPE